MGNSPIVNKGASSYNKLYRRQSSHLTTYQYEFVHDLLTEEERYNMFGSVQFAITINES